MPNRSNSRLSRVAMECHWIGAGGLLGIAVVAAQPAFRPTAGQEPGAIEDALEARVQLSIIEQAGPTGHAPVPARIHLENAAGQPVRPEGYPTWNDHFVCDGTARLDLPHGQYTFEVERGPEYRMAKGSFAAVDARPTQVAVTLERIVDLADEGWWSGDLHIHRSLDDAELLMRAEDLHIAQFTTWWNQANPWEGNGVASKQLTIHS